MSITAATLRNRILENIGVLASGETASAEDAALCDALVTDLHEALVHDGLAAWSTATIPNEASEYLVKAMSYRVGVRFGIPATRKEELKADETDGRADLARLRSSNRGGEPVTGQYY